MPPFLTVKKIPNSILKERVRDNWLIWKPVKAGILSYSEAVMMDDEQLMEAGTLVDMIDKANKGRKGRRG
ncbi:hypothetical protein CHH71_12270 [Shouchella clausii]|nr:hypothetical protein CHH71_12270 [Shouchella clausii]